MRTASTLAGLDALVAGGHLDADDADRLRASYRFCERARNARYLHAGAKADSLPNRPEEAVHLARMLGFDERPETSLRETYRQLTRRARAVVERVFYDRGTRGRRLATPLASTDVYAAAHGLEPARQGRHRPGGHGRPRRGRGGQPRPRGGRGGRARLPGALVAGIHTYGWACEAIIDALGEGWLDDGWADVVLPPPGPPRRRAGHDVRARSGPAGGRRAHGGRPASGRRAGGQVGAGGRPGSTSSRCPNGADPSRRCPRPNWCAWSWPPPGRPGLPAHGRRRLPSFARAWAATRLDDHDPRWHEGDRPRLHPSFLAGRMTPLFRHNYRYGPAIHVRTRIQHLAPARAGQELVGRRPAPRRLRAQGPSRARERLLDLRRGRHRAGRQAPYRHLQGGGPLMRRVSERWGRR